MSKEKLPVGITSFEELRSEGYIYIDKTDHIASLISSGKFYFLSRPRRFGKSLLVDTMKELFEGNKPLFKDLFIEDQWDWDETHPVIHFTFAEGSTKNLDDLRSALAHFLTNNAETLKIELSEEANLVRQFANLVKATKTSYGKNVVILIDEYDKPILDMINKAGLDEVRDLLRDFYSVIKSQDSNVRFAFLTGVSKFSKVSLFSGLNNIVDITLSPQYSTICGYTQEELDTSFKPLLVDVDMAKVKRWYNGYSWLGEPVYNPFNVLLFLQNGKRFKPFWFETGTPRFLIELLKSGNYYVPNFEQMEASDALLSSLEIDRIKLETLLFQTGYLTIRNVVEHLPKTFYTLSYPNIEVRSSFNEVILSEYLLEAKPNLAPAASAFLNENMETIQSEIENLFQAIPYQNYTRNRLSSYEGYYASVLYSFIAALGFEVTAEDSFSHGRIDLAITVNTPAGETVVFVCEFKVDPQAPGAAMQQILSKKYHEKYRNRADRIHLLGIEFSSEKRNLSRFDHQQV